MGHLILVAVCLVLLAGICLAARAAWRNRQVDFTCQIRFSANGEDAAAELLDLLLPMLVQYGYKSSIVGGHTSVFERRSIPGWAIIVAIFLFPVGLLALLARDRDMISVMSSDTSLDVSGSCNKALADYVIALGEELEAGFDTALAQY